MHIHGLAHAASGYHKVLEENRKLYNQVQDLKGNKISICQLPTCLHTASLQNSWLVVCCFDQEVSGFIVEWDPFYLDSQIVWAVWIIWKMEISLLTPPQGMGKDKEPSASTKSLGHLQPKVDEVLLKRRFSSFVLQKQNLQSFNTLILVYVLNCFYVLLFCSWRIFWYATTDSFCPWWLQRLHICIWSNRIRENFHDGIICFVYLKQWYFTYCCFIKYTIINFVGSF